VQSRYIGKLRGGPEVYVPDHIPAYVYFDTTLSYSRDTFGHPTEIFLTVNNVFNKVFPVWPGAGAAPGAGSSTLPQVYNTMLRYFTVGVRAKM
jgi:outer membrane receptor protein involved in Fe transport